MSKEALSTVATRHQVFLERLKAQKVADFTQVLPQLERAVRDVLSELRVDTLNELSVKALNSLLSDLRAKQAELVAEAEKMLVTDLGDLSKYEAGLEKRALEAATAATKRASGVVRVLGAKDAYADALKTPLSATGQLMEPFIKTWGEKHISGVGNAVRRGWAEGRTVGQVMTEIRGTKKNNYEDGLVGVSRRQAEAVVRTSTQHVAQQARQSVWEENDDLVVGVIFIATLDGKTTQQCRSLDQKEFPLDKGPRPPLHVNCRSTTIPRLPKEFDFLDEGATRSSKDGYVPANQSYYDWLKGQPAAFQDEALGPARAKLFREGGLTADQFAKLNLGRNFEPMTLRQMAAKEPALFEKVGLDKYIPSTEGA